MMKITITDDVNEQADAHVTTEEMWRIIGRLRAQGVGGLPVKSVEERIELAKKHLARLELDKLFQQAAERKTAKGTGG